MEGALSARSEGVYSGMDEFLGSRRLWGAVEHASFSTSCSLENYLGATTVESDGDFEGYEGNTCLAEEVAQAMLEDEDVSAKKGNYSAWGAGAYEPVWNGQMSSSPTSPQSTLAAVDGYNWESTSPDGMCSSGSGLSSPPTPVGSASLVKDVDDRFDELYGELVRLKLETEVKAFQQKQALSRQQQIIKPPAAVISKGAQFTVGDRVAVPRMGRYDSLSSRGRSEEECYQGKFRARSYKQAAAAGWGSGRGAVVFGQHGVQYNGGSRQRGWGDSEAMHHHVHQQFSLFAGNSNSCQVGGGGAGEVPAAMMKGRGGSGLRAVFLQGSPGSRECGGTGVFLPRTLGSASEARRKPACSTVLLPSRIVHALNLNIEDTLPFPVRRDLSSTHPLRRNSQASMPRMRSSYSTTLQEVAPDINLPMEWTY